VVPVGDAEALRQAITKLWNDPELCHRMGEYNRKWVIESFSTWHYAERAAGMMGVEVVDAIHPE
jgi:glycosyltransferase involved in cell wall biosynthesis